MLPKVVIHSYKDLSKNCLSYDLGVQHHQMFFYSSLTRFSTEHTEDLLSKPLIKNGKEICFAKLQQLEQSLGITQDILNKVNTNNQISCATEQWRRRSHMKPLTSKSFAHKANKPIQNTETKIVIPRLQTLSSI
jgi:hypothetical protein